MNPMVELLSHPAARRVGWALVHFVWQGAVVAALLAAALRLLRNGPPQARWAAGCLALAVMAALPVVTAAVVSVDGPPAQAAAEAPAEPPAEGAAAGGAAMAPPPMAPRPAPPAAEDPIMAAPAPAGPADAPPPAARPPAAPWAQRARRALHPVLPWAVLAWVVGVVGLSVWHLGGWVLLARAWRLGAPPDGAGVREAFEALRRRLAVRRPVRLLESVRVAVPAVVGWLRPVVLLPVGAMTGLTPRQLEAVLAHELAHVRRCDGLVRLLQAAVETLLFYHPAVWWVSARIRAESEQCCDDLAVAATGDRPGYARALARVAELGRRRPHLAAAATGGRLLPRIRRVLGLAQTPARTATSWITGAVLLTALATAGLVIYGCGAGAPPATQPGEARRLGPRQVLRISVLELFEEGKEAVFERQVSDGGTISLPLLKERLKVEGLTQEELHRAIVKAYAEAKILKSPSVAVMILSAKATPPATQPVTQGATYRATALLRVHPPVKRAERLRPEAVVRKAQQEASRSLVSDAVMRRSIQSLKQTGWIERHSGQGMDPVRELRAALRVKPVPETNLIALSMDGHDPAETAKIVNAVAQAAVDHSAGPQVRDLQDESDRLQSERDRLAKQTAGLAAPRTAEERARAQQLVTRLRDVDKRLLALRLQLKTTRGRLTVAAPASVPTRPIRSGPATQPGARRARPGLILRISVLELFEEGKEAVFERQVSDGGTISLPLLKERLKVEGLTQEELHRAIVKAYAEPKILKSPSVAVMILSAKATATAVRKSSPQVTQPAGEGRAQVLAELLHREMELKFQLAQTRRKFGPRHRKNKELEAQLEDVQKLIREAKGPATPPGPSTGSGPSTQPARGGAEWHSDALKRDLARLLREPRVSLINPRGKTVENLRIIKRAIEDYRLEKKALPASLKDLQLPAAVLRDGSGRDLMWSGRVATYGHAPGKGSTILVGMRSPVSRLLKREQWWYAIIRTADGDIRISGGTDLRPLAAFTPAKASIERDKAGNLTVRLSPADAPAWGIRKGLNDVVVWRVKDDRLDVTVKMLQLPGGRDFRTRTSVEVKPGQKILIGGTDRWQVSVERANRPATQPAGKSLGDAQKAFHKKWSIQGGWGAWGALSGANRARLLAQRTRWQPGQTPQFMVEAEGRGSIDFGVEPSQAAACRVELDGQWYDYAGKALKPERGAHFGVPISLTREWKGAAGRLALKPGKHSVRVAFPFPPPPAKRITWLVSAPLQFEIVNAKAAPPATRKADKPAPSTGSGPSTQAAGEGRAEVLAELLHREMALKSQLAQTRRKFGPRHRKNKELEARLEGVRKLIREAKAPATRPAVRHGAPPATQPAAVDSDASTTLPSPGNGAWSKTVDGLRMRLVGPAAPVGVDETFDLRMLIQNVSDKPIGIRRPLFLSVIRDPAEHPGNREEARWSGCVITATWPHRVKRLWNWHSSTRQTNVHPSILQPRATYTVIITVRGPGGDREKARLKDGPQRETVTFLYHGLAGKYPLTATYAVPRGTANAWCGTLVAAPVNVELVSPPAVRQGSPQATQPAGSRLGFRIVPNAAGSSRLPVLPLLVGKATEKFLPRAMKELAEKGPDPARRRKDAFQWYEVAGEVNFPDAVIGRHGGRKYVLLATAAPHVMLAGEGKDAWHLAKVYVTPDGSGRPVVGFEFDDRGAKRFAAFTKANVGNAVAILVDGKVLSAPVLRTALGSRGIIAGRFTDQQARDLVRTLKAGMPSGLVDSDILQMAATRVLADYIVAEGRKGVMPKAATQPAYLVKFIEGLKARYPRSVMTTPPEEKALAAGKFDDAGNARRLAAAAKRLEAAEAALPAVARFILKQQNDKALKGAKLEFARRLMEAIAADVARAAASRESAGLTKALNLTPAQQAKVKAWVKAWLEARKEDQAPNPAELVRFLNSILDDRQRALLRGIIESGTVPPTTQTGAATAPAPRR